MGEMIHEMVHVFIVDPKGGGGGGGGGGDSLGKKKQQVQKTAI